MNVILSGGLSFIVRFIGASILFLLTLLISRELGVHESGYYFLTYALVSVLGIISKVGFDATILKLVGIAHAKKDFDEVRAVFFKTTSIALSFSVFIAIAFYLCSEVLAYSFFSKQELVEVFKSSVFYIPLFVVSSFLAMVLQGMRCTIKSIIILNIFASAFVVFAILLLDFESAEGVIKFLVLAILLSSFLGVFFLRNIVFRKGQKTILMSTLLSSGVPLWFGTMVGLIIQWSGQLILGFYDEVEQVSLLAVAQRTSMLVALILMSVNMVISPIMASLYNNKDMVGLRRVARTSSRLMVIFALPILLVMMFFPERILSVFGDDFREADILLRILAVGQFINVLSGSVGYLLSMSGHEKDLRNAIFISGLVCGVLSLCLIPSYGALG